jgi:hypothetical protein
MGKIASVAAVRTVRALSWTGSVSGPRPAPSPRSRSPLTCSYVLLLRRRPSRGSAPRSVLPAARHRPTQLIDAAFDRTGRLQWLPKSPPGRDIASSLDATPAIEFGPRSSIARWTGTIGPVWRTVNPHAPHRKDSSKEITDCGDSSMLRQRVVDAERLAGLQNGSGPVDRHAGRGEPQIIWSTAAKNCFIRFLHPCGYQA